MAIQEIITNSESNPVSVKEQLRQEIEQTPDEILARVKVVVALRETMQLMAEIERLIPGFPIH